MKKRINMKLNYKNFLIRKVSKKQLQNLQFDCEDNDLNDFLYNESLNYCKDNLAIVYLIFQEDMLLGYFSLSSDSIKINKKLDIKLQYYPSIKIGRLAIDKKFKKMGVGTWIIGWIIGYALKIRSGHGIRFLSVDAYNKDVIINFYEKNKFVIYKKEKNMGRLNIPMYLDINKRF